MKVNEGYEGYVLNVMKNLDYWSRLYSSGGSEKLWIWTFEHINSFCRYVF